MADYSEKSLYDRLMFRHGELKQMRQPYEPCWDEIIDIFRSDIERFEQRQGQGERDITLLGAHMFESTPAWCAVLMTQGWQGYIISRTIEWVKHQLNDMKGIDEVNKWLQVFDDYIYEVYAKSELYDNIGEYILDGVTVGSPVTIIEEHPYKEKTLFQVPHPSERFLGQNAFGEIDTLHLERIYTTKQAYELFAPLKNVSFDTGTKRLRVNKAFSEGLQNDYKNGQYSQRRTFIKCFHHFLDPVLQGKLRPEERPRAPWMGYTLEVESKKKQCVKIEPYWEKPFVDWPYRKRPNRVYAITPAWLAYYDSLSIQDAREGILMAGSLITRPPMWLPAIMKRSAELFPEGLNFFKNEQEYKLKPEPILNVHGNSYPIGAEMEDRLARACERWFHKDLFLLLSKYSLEQKAPPTAYHIMQMMGERANLIAPVVGNFTSKLEEIDNRIISIENNAGRLPEAPPIVYELSNGNLKPEFVGPFAQIQSQYHETRRMQNTLLQVEPFINLDPLSARMIKAEIAIEHILEKNKFLQDAITSQEEYQQIKAAVAQAQEMREGIQIGTEVAKALPAAGKAVEEGSPLKLITGAA